MVNTIDVTLQVEDSQFVDSPYKVYIGNISSTVSTETLKNFFSEKAKVLSAKVSRVPGTSKSSGYGFVTFSSEEEVEAAISSFNNAVSNLLPFSIISIVVIPLPIYEGPVSLSSLLSASHNIPWFEFHAFATLLLFDTHCLVAHSLFHFHT